jgi:peptide deformylase
MAILKIAQLGEPLLRRKSAAVDPKLIASAGFQRLIDDMIETMHDADGAGLAAPQVYQSLRLVVMEVEDNPRYPDVPDIPLLVLINPVVTPLVPTTPELAPADSISMYEGCLSVNGIRGRVRRPRKVKVTGLDRNGAPLEFIWEGFQACVVQHEVDHLDGVLFVDRADPRTLAFLREFARFVDESERIVDHG